MFGVVNAGGQTGRRAGARRKRIFCVITYRV